MLKVYFLSFLSIKNKDIINITVQANTDIVFNGVVFAPQTSKNKAPAIIPNAYIIHIIFTLLMIHYSLILFFVREELPFCIL